MGTDNGKSVTSVTFLLQNAPLDIIAYWHSGSNRDSNNTSILFLDICKKPSERFVTNISTHGLRTYETIINQILQPVYINEVRRHFDTQKKKDELISDLDVTLDGE